MVTFLSEPEPSLPKTGLPFSTPPYPFIFQIEFECV